MTSRREFLVRIEIEADEVDPALVADLRTKEAARAQELASDGTLARVWRRRQGWSNIGLWRAETEKALEAALDSLPLRPYMTIEIEPLEPHPSDPAPWFVQDGEPT